MNHSAADRVRVRVKRKHQFRLFCLVASAALLSVGLVYFLLNLLTKDNSSSAPSPANPSDDTSVHFK